MLYKLENEAHNGQYGLSRLEVYCAVIFDFFFFPFFFLGMPLAGASLKVASIIILFCFLVVEEGESVIVKGHFETEDKEFRLRGRYESEDVKNSTSID